MEEKKENEVTNNSQNSNKNGIIAILAVIIIVLIGAVIYFAFIKKDEPTTDNNGGNNQQENGNTSAGKNEVVLSNDEAIKIAKEKIEMANTNKLIGDTCFEGKEFYNGEGEDPRYCYYDTIDNFNKKFYSIYSSKLKYSDVLIEYNSSTGELSKGTIGNIPEYAIKNNKVYTSGCMIGSGSYKRMDKFAVDSIDSYTIKLNYVAIGDSIPEIPEESEEYELSKASMILVKENGEWKILKATIVDQCNGVYEVGK